MGLQINPYRVLITVAQNYRRKWKDADFPVTGRERELGKALQEIIDDYILGKTVLIEEDECTLESDFDEAKVTSLDIEDFESESPLLESSDQPSSSSSYKPSQDVTKCEFPSWEKVVEAVKFWRSTKPHPIKKKKPHLDIGTVKNCFSFVKNEAQLYRWEKLINANNSPRSYKLAQLVNDVRSEFQEERMNQLPVHDRDLVRWSLHHAKKLKISDFKCSSFWLWNFKKLSRISNRKVTKFVSRSSVEQSGNIVLQAEEFVSVLKGLIVEFGPDNVYNMDQSGFERCMMSRSTLAETGSSTVKVVTQSTSGLTHTYTIQPTISASGRLVTPVTICLQETQGEFGKFVKSSMFKCPELIYPVASKSGKMGKDQLREWFQNVMLPTGGNRFVLIVDSYSAHKGLIELIPEGHDVRIMSIPPGATGLIQPLDVHGFRYWKDMARHLNREAMIAETPVPMFTRNSILQMQTLIVRLLSSAKLQQFWKYPWTKCGYLLEEQTEHKSPMRVCVGDTELCCQCENLKCIDCPWCEKSYCFEHIFVKLHINCNSN